MILQSLVEYYEILTKCGEIPAPGYCKANVSYALNIAEDGMLVSIISLKMQVVRGKKTVEVPQVMEVPEQVKRAVGISPNFLCDNSGYVLGVDNKGKPDRSKKCFEAFKELHHNILEKADCREAKAVLLFLDHWKPEMIEQEPLFQDCIEEIISGANLVFQIDDLGYAQDCREIRQEWEQHRKESTNSIKMQCLVTGKVDPIARLHPSIKGVKGAQAMGASIVSFNARAYESYGHDDQQGLNAPVSEYAAFAYTTALNYLLSDMQHKQTYGDTTVVYWANSPKPIYRSLFAYALNPSEPSNEVTVNMRAEGMLHALFSKLVQGKPIGEYTPEFDKDTRFYVLGLAPNAARLSVRFYMENSFGNIMNNVASHYQKLDIEKSPKEFEFLPLWKLLLETVPPMAKDKSASPLLAGSVLRAILSGSTYPEALYSNVIVRIRAQQDISRGKAAIIKACLLRNRYSKYKEELTVSLNEESNNKAYVLGRMFAVLEKTQQDANPGINATIKDRYFASACATPSSVFPILFKLFGYHMSKSKYGYICSQRMENLMEKLEIENHPFPAHLSLDEQGLFVLGYYHQQKANYAKTEKEEK